MRVLRPLSLRADQINYTVQIVLAALVGLLAALGNLGFRELIRIFTWIFRDLEWNAIGISRGGVRLGWLPLILLSGGAGMILLDRLFPGDVLGYGFPNFLEMVNLGSARIKRRWIVLKGLGAALSLGCGASVGREGPIAQIGGAIGSAVAQLRGMSASRAKVLVAAGAGAGIATTFNAPVGGVLFAQEIVLLGETELGNLTLLLVATVSAVILSRAITGNAAVFRPTTFLLRSYWELLSYALMGVLLGVLSAAYIHFFHAVAGSFRVIKAQWARLAAGLIVVGIIAIPLPQNLSDGYPIINQAMAGQYGITMTLALTVAKFISSSISLGCGAPGGVFGPTFFIGTMAGATFQRAMASIIPDLTGPRGSYALIGLGTFLCGVTHAPLTALFLLLDMTQDYQIATPAMIAIVIALIVSRSLERESIDTYRLARQGKTLEIGRERMMLTQIPVDGVMTRDPVVVKSSAPFQEVLHVAGETEQATLPVVNEGGKLLGIIVTRDLVTMMGSEADVVNLVNAYDICRRNCPMVNSDSNLDDAAQLMESEDLEELPVVEAAPPGQRGYRLVGIVARKDIGQVLNRMALSLTSLTTTGTGIFWATGYRLMRITVPPEAQGKTMLELAPRARYGVSVLAVQSARAGETGEDGFVPITPNYKLSAGDTIMAAGRPQDLRRFSRELEGS
jgi:chloride channel protein, CIC family